MAVGRRTSGTYVRQPVKLGIRSGPLVEILDGAFPGDPVVLTGRHELASLFAAADEQVAATSAAPVEERGQRGTAPRRDKLSPKGRSSCPPIKRLPPTRP